ncbi:MAG: hypothetical protein HQM16_02705 [Deltaproteobacteria bacterium]|nr:hypothetical protein [Deltaproteobacteria bacterium]
MVQGITSAADNNSEITSTEIQSSEKSDEGTTNDVVEPPEGIGIPTNNTEGPATPPISIINPKLDAGRFLCFKNDAQGNVPIVVQAGAVENFDAGDQIAVSAEAFTPEFSCNENKPVIASEARQSSLYNMLIPTAHAQTTTSCSDEFTYCPIADDGSFKCFVNPGVSTEKLYFTIVDKDCAPATDVVTEDHVQKNLLYVGTSPTDVKDVGDELYSIADGNGVIARDDGSGMRVAGDYNLGYKTFDADGTALAFADTDGLVGVMGDNGVQLLDYNAGTVIDTGEKAIDPNAKAYTFLRAMNGVLYYGIEQESADEGYINFAVTEEKLVPRKHKWIWITRSGDTDTQGNEIRHTRTLGFGGIQLASFPHTWTIVAFSDGDNIRIRAIFGDGSLPAFRGKSDVWKSVNECSIKDIIAYNSDDVDNINFVMLDSKNKKIDLGRYNISSNTRTIDDTKAVDVGNNPAAMDYSAKSGNLYVLNRDDATISVISLMLNNRDVTEKPVVKRIIKLADQVPGKSINFESNNILVKDSQLVVTDEATKALLMVDINADETDLLDE